MGTRDKHMSYFQIQDKDLSYESIDGEVIVIHFNTGCYYSMTESAAHLWQRLQQPASLADLHGCFTGAPEQISGGVAKFLGELTKEELVAEVPAPAELAGGVASILPPVPYSPVEFQKYTDMQELLLADPLHDVGEVGWPKLKE